MDVKCDVASLTEIVDRCFDLSMDNRLTEAQNGAYLVLGKRLRGTLLNIISARFREGTPELLQANARLSTINGDLKLEAKAIQNAADTLDSLGKLVGGLDHLLGVAASFV